MRDAFHLTTKCVIVCARADFLCFSVNLNEQRSNWYAVVAVVVVVVIIFLLLQKMQLFKQLSVYH